MNKTIIFKVIKLNPVPTVENEHVHGYKIIEVQYNHNFLKVMLTFAFFFFACL